MKTSVLLVEDERDARESLARTLERSGHHCDVAASRDEALAVVQGPRTYDVIVSDVVLGTEDNGGLDLIVDLRQRGVLAPIVIITAFADVDKVKRALNRGAAYLIEKPFRAQELISVLAQVGRSSPDITSRVERVLAAAGLTDKELQVARYLLKGLTTAEIASLEKNSDKTIRQHVSRIYAKCGVSSRAEFFHHVLPF